MGRADYEKQQKKGKKRVKKRPFFRLQPLVAIFWVIYIGSNGKGQKNAKKGQKKAYFQTTATRKAIFLFVPNDLGQKRAKKRDFPDFAIFKITSPLF